MNGVFHFYFLFQPGSCSVSVNIPNVSPVLPCECVGTSRGSLFRVFFNSICRAGMSGQICPWEVFLPFPGSTGRPLAGFSTTKTTRSASLTHVYYLQQQNMKINLGNWINRSSPSIQHQPFHSVRTKTTTTTTTHFQSHKKHDRG